MIDYYKGKLANLREIARGVIILLITLLSGTSYIFIKILLDGFKSYEFAIVNSWIYFNFSFFDKIV